MVKPTQVGLISAPKWVRFTRRSPREGAVGFPLPILTEWFAAQSIREGSPEIADVVKDRSRLERWRYPLIIAVGTLNEEKTSRLLTSVMKSDPAFGAEVITKALDQWALDKQVAPPRPIECGRQIRASMESTTRGIGPLAQLIAPIGGDGTVLPIGVCAKGARIQTSWYEGSGSPPQVMELLSKSILPSGLSPTGFAEASDFREGWLSSSYGPPGSQPAWAWRWTLDFLTGRLKKRIRNRDLPCSDGPIAHEKAWEIALNITEKSPFETDTIEFYEIEERLQEFIARKDELRRSAMAQLADIHPSQIVIHSTVPDAEISFLLKQVEQWRSKESPNLPAPWPGPDRSLFHGRITDDYSDEAFQTRITAVYESAIKAYVQLVNQWFPAFKHRLNTSITLPARLVIRLAPRQANAIPSMLVYFEALSQESETVVDVSFDEIESNWHSHQLLNRLYGILSECRSEAVSAFVKVKGTLITDEFRNNAISGIVYDWIASDLKRIGWL